VSPDEAACPFCQTPFGLTRRDFAVGAAAFAAVGLAPVADAARAPEMQQEEYGVPRPVPEPVGPSAVDAIYDDWLSEVGILNAAESWATHKPQTVVRYSSTDGSRPARVNATLTLMKVADAAVTINIGLVGRKAEERVFARGAGIPKDAKVTDEGKETIEVDGTKYECEAKAHELPGRTFKVWWCKDAPLGFAKVTCGEETTRLVKAKESVKLAWGEADCSVWETTVGDTVRKVWRSEKTPGLVVRLETMTKKALTLKVEIAAMTEGK
jgi:hypothetical protein